MYRREWLTEEFERHRSPLRAVAYRMLGSISEAEDAVQESWVRLDRVIGSARLAHFARPSIVNGAAGVVLRVAGRPIAVAGFTIFSGRIAAIDVIADQAKLRSLEIS